MDRRARGKHHDLALNRRLVHVGRNIASRTLLDDGQRVLVAVSGGLDSMVLLHVLHSLSRKRKWELIVAHFNHQLRGDESDADEHLARKTAKVLRIPFVAGRGDVAEEAKARSVSVEMAARTMRHDFFADTAKKLGLATVALAHHADDQVELFFLRLLRGSGTSGLSGMAWKNASAADPKLMIIRPLLDLDKRALRELADHLGVKYSDDATNADLDFDRNRIRHELLPLLKSRYQPRLEERILSLMEMLGAEAEMSAGFARRWLERQPGSVARFYEIPAAVQRKIVYLQLLQLGVPPNFDLIERLRLTPGKPIEIAPGKSFFRNTDGIVRLCEMFADDCKNIVLMQRKRSAEFSDLEITWAFQTSEKTAPAKLPNVEFFDADKIGSKALLRHWQQGDRFQPIGMPAPVKLQDLFSNLKVPRDERHRRVVAVTEQGELFWVEGLRVSERFKLGSSTKRQLKWEWTRKLRP